MTIPRLAILDRDGVINRDSADYIKTPGEWQPLPGSLEAIARLSRGGWTVAVATNQSGVGRGLFDRQTLYRIHAKLRAAVRAAGGELGRIAYCPHAPGDGCDCRKPSPAMILDLCRHYRAAPAETPVVGDSVRDVEAARAAGAIPLLVLTGNGREAERALADLGRPALTAPDLAGAADLILSRPDSLTTGGA